MISVLHLSSSQTLVPSGPLGGPHSKHPDPVHSASSHLISKSDTTHLPTEPIKPAPWEERTSITLSFLFFKPEPSDLKPSPRLAPRETPRLPGGLCSDPGPEFHLETSAFISSSPRGWERGRQAITLAVLREQRGGGAGIVVALGPSLELWINGETINRR